MSDQARADAVAEADSLQHGGPAGSGNLGFTWPKIVLAVGLLVGIIAVAYLVLMPSSYVGDARWGRNFSTITLVGDGTTLTVDGNTQIIGRGGGSLSIELMRGPMFPPQTFVFSASVTYWHGRAWSIVEQ
jgi:hypothetical protein